LHMHRSTKTQVRGQCDFLAAEYQNVKKGEVVDMNVATHYTVDTFSTGIVAGMLFGEGRHIFHLPGESEAEIRSNIIHDRKNLDAIKNSKYKNRIAIANFVDACTQHDPAKRPTAEECRDHELFKSLEPRSTRY
jgi:serine/threonine protein kinase